MKKICLICFFSIAMFTASVYTAKAGISQAQIESTLKNEQEVSTSTVLSDFEIDNHRITKYVGKGGDVIIPIGIIAINDHAFSGNSSITSVTIPDSVLEIGEYAFADCTGLKKVIIGNGVKEISESVFMNNKALSSLTLGNKLQKIQANAFRDCFSLKKLTMPDSITDIGKYAFFGCYELSEVNWSQNLRTIGESSFSNLPKLKTVKIPNSVETIEDSAFMGSKITTLVLGNRVNYIGMNAFGDIDITTLDIPDSVKKIGGYAFHHIPNLESITIGSGLSEISYYAFYDNEKLKSVTFGENVSIIDSYAFASNTNLKDIKLNAKMRVIRDHAFSSSGLESISLNNGLTMIAAGAFAYTNLSKLEMLDTITFVGPSAFTHCESLQYIKLSRNLKEIPYKMFESCTSLTEIVIPDQVKTIDVNAFNNCTGLKKVIIGKGVTTIREKAFSNTSNLTEIYIPANVIDISKSIFYDNWDKQSNSAVIIGDKNTEAYTFALSNGFKFRFNTQINSISLNQNVKKLKPGESFTIQPILNPSSAGNTSLRYTLGNYTIATVDSFGKVTGLRPGSTYLTITSANGKTAKCLIKVEGTEPLKNINFTATKVTMSVGNVYATTVKPYPEYYQLRNISYTSSNSKVAKVSTDGKISALCDGTAVITAKNENGLKTSIIVNVKPANVKALKFPVSVQTITLGKSVNLKATVYPSYAKDKTITYSVGNNRVASVDEEGNVKATGIGNTYLYAKANNGVSIRIAINVLPAIPTSVVFNTTKVTMKKNTTYSPVVKIYPDYVSDKSVSYHTGNPNIASVDDNGTVVAKNAGNTYLYVTTWNGLTSRVAILVK